jgi:acyl-CoA thioesterase
VTAFADASTPVEVGPGRFTLTIPDGWQQGRGAFGGLVLAPMVRAAEATAAAADRALRTLTAEIFAPVVTGPIEIAVETLRAGSGTSTMAVRLLQEGSLCAHAVCVLGRDRSGPLVDGIARGAAPPWRDVPVLRGLAPFTQHFEYRATLPPFVGGEARASGYVRTRVPEEKRDAALIVALADAWFPALFGVMTAPRPMATLTFTLDLCANLDGLAPEEPFFHESHTLSSRDGYAPELRRLWGADGRLVAINHQTFVVIQ